jgi:hypothetical protein
VLKLGHFGRKSRSTWKISKCDAGEGWRRSVGPVLGITITEGQRREKHYTNNKKKEG